MATITQAQVPHALRRAEVPPGYQEGWFSWITTVDAKRIGILYGVSAFIFFLIAGVEAEIMRIQLFRPNQHVVSADLYNQLFTMHGTAMIFLVVMPLNAAFFNYIVPPMIGARDVAFPRLNAWSYWVFLAGGLLLHMSFFLGGAPNVGWFGYANLTEKAFNSGHGVDFWLFGLQLLGFSSLAAAFNFMITIINMRAPGMKMMRMPPFAWMTLFTNFLMILAFPVLTVALFELMFDRIVGTNFFNAANGAQPLLWVHLFWIFGHPEVYILILPAMGIISEVITTFSHKPLFGYPVVIFSGMAIAFFGFGVWAHHMFTVGLGPIADSVFAVFTMIIAVPTGVKVFNWIATLWGGSINMKTPLYFALGFISMFILGGLTGIMHAEPPPDLQQHGSYFVVAHLHYVLYGGSIFGLLAGLHYWFPKYTGRMMNDRLGKLTFWVMFIGFNITFMPMHWTGLLGMPRRVYTYNANLGVTGLNEISTVGAFILGASVLIFIYNFYVSYRYGEKAGADPWDGSSLEWATSSPPPVYNFAVLPPVYGREAFWALKYPRDASGTISPVPQKWQPAPEEIPISIHMPRPSIWPVVVALGLFMVLSGFIFTPVETAVGLVTMFTGIAAWAMEPPAGEPSYPPRPSATMAPEAQPSPSLAGK